MTNTAAVVFLSLGSNLGDSRLQLQNAVISLGQEAGTVQAVSPLYQTNPWGKTDQPDFLNLALALETFLSPEKLMETLLSIEQKMGRKRIGKWGPRTIDIDILFYNDTIIDQTGLHIPHPALHQRRFVLAPLNDIAPDFMHPILKKTILQLLKDCPDESEIYQAEGFAP